MVEEPDECAGRVKRARQRHDELLTQIVRAWRAGDARLARLQATGCDPASSFYEKSVEWERDEVRNLHAEYIDLLDCTLLHYVSPPTRHRLLDLRDRIDPRRNPRRDLSDEDVREIERVQQLVAYELGEMPGAAPDKGPVPREKAKWHRAPSGENDAERLKAIARELEAAAHDLCDVRWTHLDALSAASRLLLEAIELGAFADPTYVDLLARVNLWCHKPDAELLVIVNAAAWLVEHNHMPGKPRGDVGTAFEAMATWLPAMIRAQAERMEAANRLGTEESSAAPVHDDSPPGCVFRLRGDNYEIQFGRSVLLPLRVSKGLTIVAALLARPNPQVAIPALELLGSVHEEAPPTTDATLDGRALTAVNIEIENLKHLIEQAERAGSFEMQAKYERDLQRLVQQLKTDTGLGNRARPLGPKSPAERARDAVRKNLDRVYAKIGSIPQLEELLKHLQDSIRVEGDGFAYRPKRIPDWIL